MILFFDTETTGKVDFRMPADHPTQPNLVQLAMLVTEDDGTERASASLIVMPDAPIPAEAAAIHGITTEIAERCGLGRSSAVMLFRRFIGMASLIVAHNIDFDAAVMTTAALRAAIDLPPLPTPFCTMKTATAVCKIPHANPRRPDDWKWPKLAECIKHFFGEELTGAHDAMVDVRACKRVYFKLLEAKP